MLVVDTSLIYRTLPHQRNEQNTRCCVGYYLYLEPLAETHGDYVFWLHECKPFLSTLKTSTRNGYMFSTSHILYDLDMNNRFYDSINQTRTRENNRDVWKRTWTIDKLKCILGASKFWWLQITPPKRKCCPQHLKVKMIKTFTLQRVGTGIQLWKN